MTNVPPQLREETSADAASYALTRLPLRNLRIDPRQPRQYLPADLRAQAASGKFAAPVIMAELERREAAGDLEASQYLKDIDELAESLRADGLIYPLKVEALDAPDAYGAARILDGERRYWAIVRCAMQGEARPFELAEVDVLVRQAQLDERARRRLQWQANSQRRGMPVMALAEAVAQIHGELAAALQANRGAALARFGLAGEAKGRDRTLLVKMTALDVRARTGRALSERMVYRLLMFVNRLTPEARALAKAADLDYRALERIASAAPEQQIDVIAQVLSAEPVGPLRSTQAQAIPPSVLCRHMQQCVALTHALLPTRRVWELLQHAPATFRAEYLTTLREMLDVVLAHVQETEELENKLQQCNSA